MNPKVKLAKRFAQLTGISLLLMALLAGIGYGYSFSTLYTNKNELINFDPANGLLRTTILCFVFILLLDVLVSWLFYQLFKHINQSLSLLAAWLRLLYSALLATSLCHLITITKLPLELLANPATVTYQLDAFLSTWSFALLLFGCHLIVLGTILWQSVTVPKLLSRLALFAGCCYILTSLADLSFPEYSNYKATVDNVLALPMALGELTLAIWLVRTGLAKNEDILSSPN